MASPKSRPAKKADIPAPNAPTPNAAFVPPTALTAMIAPRDTIASGDNSATMPEKPFAASFIFVKFKSASKYDSAASPATRPPKKADIATPIMASPFAPANAAPASAPMPNIPSPRPDCFCSSAPVTPGVGPAPPPVCNNLNLSFSSNCVLVTTKKFIILP